MSALEKQNIMAFQPFFPDVVGAITGGPRINMDALEVAVGVHPKQVFINQPVEVVIALQNMVDKDLNLKIAARTPNEDRSGNPVLVEFGKSQVSMTLKAGEVGVLRMPLIVHPPTKPAKGIPVRVAIRYRVRDARPVRPAGGGSPPSVLSVSPFKLQVLREVEFIAHKWNESTDILTCYFDLAPKHFPGDSNPPAPRYETLWGQEAMQEEIKLARTVQCGDFTGKAQPNRDALSLFDGRGGGSFRQTQYAPASRRDHGDCQDDGLHR